MGGHGGPRGTALKIVELLTYFAERRDGQSKMTV
jgi:hypothetical protein